MKADRTKEMEKTESEKDRKAEQETEEDIIIAYEPSPHLRELIGENIKLKDVFTPERIKSCQRLFDDARDAFFETALPELESLKASAGSLETGQNAYVFTALIGPAAHIKSQADAFGLVFVSQISAKLVTCCEASATAAKKMGPLAQMLIEALELAFREKITDDGGDTGRAMLKSLKSAA